MSMMPQLHPAPAQPTMHRDPTEHTQANFPSLTPRQLAVLAQLEMQDQQALRSNAHTILQPSLPVGTGGPVQGTGLGQTQATNAPRSLETTQDAHTRLRSAPPMALRGRCIRAVHPPRAAAEAAQDTHRRRRRSRSRYHNKRSRSHRARRTHRHRPRTHHSRSLSQRSRGQAFILCSRSQLGSYQCLCPASQKRESRWSYRAPPTHHSAPHEGHQPSQPLMKTEAPQTQYVDLGNCACPLVN